MGMLFGTRKAAEPNRPTVTRSATFERNRDFQKHHRLISVSAGRSAARPPPAACTMHLMQSCANTCTIIRTTVSTTQHKYASTATSCAVEEAAAPPPDG